MTRFNSSAENNPGYKFSQIVKNLDMSQWRIINANLGGLEFYITLVKSKRLRGDAELLKQLEHEVPVTLQDPQVQKQLRLDLEEVEISVEDFMSDPSYWPAYTGFVSRVAFPQLEQTARVVYREEAQIIEVEEVLPSFGIKVVINSTFRVEEASRTQFSFQKYTSLADVREALAQWTKKWDPGGKFCALFFESFSYGEYPTLAKGLPGSEPVLLETEDDWQKITDGLATFLKRYETALAGGSTAQEQQEALRLTEELDEFNGSSQQSSPYTIREWLILDIHAFDPVEWEAKKMK